MAKKTHDYCTQRWGWAISTVRLISATKVSMLGHGMGIKEGDEIQMEMKSKKVGRFEVTKISYFDNPTDMWDMEAQFLGYTDDKKD